MDEDDEEVDLRDYIEVLIKRRKFIIGITLLVVIITAIFSYFILPPVYEATGSLLVKPEEANVQFTSPEQLLSPLTYLPQISLATYQEIIKSKYIEKKVFEELNLSSPPYNLTIDDFDEMVTVENPKDSTLIKVSAKYRDPDVTQKIADTILTESLNYINSLNSSQIASSSSILEKQYLDAKKELESAEKALADFNSQADNLDSLKRKRSSYIDALNSYLSDLLQLDAQIAQYESLLSSTRAKLKSESKYIVLEKSIIDDPLLSQLAQQLSNENILYLSQLKVNSQEINPIYEDLSSKEENYTITLSGLNTKKSTLQKLVSDTQNIIHQLDEQINSKQLELNNLNRAVEIAQSNYSSIATNYVQSSLTPLSPVTIAERPIVPEKPVAPRKVFNMAIAGVAALLVSILLAFFLEYWNREKETNQKSSERSS